MATNIKIVERVVTQLPEERPLVPGEKYKVLQPNGDLLNYTVNSAGNPVFVRGVSNEQNIRLERLNNEQLSKLEGLQTQQELDDRFSLIIAGEKGSIGPEDVPPTEEGIYRAKEEGVYSNLGGLVVESGKSAWFLLRDGVWSIYSEIDSSIATGIIRLGSYGSTSGDSVYRYLQPIYSVVDKVQGKNMLNPSNILPNLFFTGTTNSVISNEGYDWKGWVVEFTPGVTYTYSGFLEGQAGTAVYVDENLNYVTNASWTAPNPLERRIVGTSNNNAKYLFFNVPKDGSRDGSLQLEVGTSSTDYQPFTEVISIPASVIDFEGSDVKEQMDTNSSDILDLQDDFNQIVEEGSPELKEVYSPLPTNGYFNSSGNFVASENWRATIAYEVKSGDPGVYEGYGVNPVIPVMWWDENMQNPTPLLTGIDNAVAPFSVPGDGYIVASYKAQDGDVQSLKLERSTYKLRPEAFKVDNVGFMPKVLWGKVGDEFRMYPAGIVPMMSDDAHLDFIWSLPRGNRDFVPVSPSNTNDISISGSVRNGLGAVSLIGSTTLKVTKEVPTSPVSPMFVMCGFGDSLTNAPTWAQEFRHRLTGEGTEIGDAVNNVDPLGLSNITFIGSKTNIVPREGNGGWGYHNWLRNSSYGADTNPAWNPNTNEFDFEYYLDQLNVPGLNANGDNLVMYSLCLWNSVYTRSLETAIADMDELFQIIHAQKPGVKIKVMGLNTPPAKFIKPERGGQTPNTVMRDIIAYNQALQDYADANSDWVEFICISAQFHPEGCYPNADRAIHLRAADIQENYATDHVHPNSRGYAQIADAAYYNFIYNYCN